MVPGRNVAKCPYVVNTGANDAYVRIRVMVPSAANNDSLTWMNGGVITNQWCSTALKGARLSGLSSSMVHSGSLACCYQGC